MFSTGAKFTALYAGNCAWCSRRWYPGDLIGFVDDELVCLDCYEKAQLENEWENFK